ncbi:putative ATP-binding cassette transporter [Fistulina hepatica ATCC 64428]|uniref:Putative ATP-binding cassette transporter n=1 Tax=Fistulina hepatica ATCC 64428 TaxID=1128425 RepID=A0A0D7AQA4_9AGAR|nr:putative ATP-binding cassette transporter [Fistulina hepatica ATCC 64428]
MHHRILSVQFVYFSRCDHAGRTYPVEVFMLSYTVLEVPFEIVSSLRFCLLGAIAANLRCDVTMYFIVVLDCFRIVSCSESLGIIFNTLFESAGFVLNITSAILSSGIFMAGVMSLDMPSFFRGINYISLLKYYITALQLSDGQCLLSAVEQVLDLYNLNIDPQPMLGALAGITVAYRLVAHLIG